MLEKCWPYCTRLPQKPPRHEDGSQGVPTQIEAFQFSEVDYVVVYRRDHSNWAGVVRHRVDHCL